LEEEKSNLSLIFQNKLEEERGKLLSLAYKTNLGIVETEKLELLKSLVTQLKAVNVQEIETLNIKIDQIVQNHVDTQKQLVSLRRENKNLHSRNQAIQFENKRINLDNQLLSSNLAYANQSIVSLQNDIIKILNTKGWKILEKLRPYRRAIINLSSSLSNYQSENFIKKIQDKLSENSIPTTQDIKFSIGIPSYNHSEYVSQCIKSCLSQTYQNFEIIVTDDNSTDKETIEILKSFEKTHPNKVKCIYHTENEGISGSINEQVINSNGDYFVMLDCDDYLDPDALLAVYKKIKVDHNPDYLFTDRKHVDEKGSLLTTVEYGGLKNLLDRGLSINEVLPMGMAASHLKVIKMDLFKRVGLMSNYFSLPGKAGCQDYDFALRCLLHKVKFSYIYKAVYNHRWHSKSVTLGNHSQQVQFSNEAQRLFEIRRFLNNIKNTYKKKEHQNQHILFVIPYLVNGGAERWLLNLASYLKNNHYTVSIFTTNGGGEWENKAREVSNHVSINNVSSKSQKQIIEEIKQFVIQNGVDIVHISNSETGYDAIPELFSLYPKPKIVDTTHSDKSGFINYSAKYASFMDARVTVNQLTSRYLLSENLSHPNKTHSIFNATSFEPKSKVPTKDNTVLMVSRLSEEKNPQLFISIANTLSTKYPDLKFQILGDGPELPRLKKLAKSNNIQFLGQVNDVENYYLKAKYIFITSLTEGMPLVLGEAMSYGCIPFSTPVGGIPEIIKNGHNGFLCNDKADFIRSFDNVYSNSRLSNLLSANGTQTVKEKLSPAVFGSSYTKLYKELLEDKSITSASPKLISICILTLNRHKALNNLLSSIKKYTKLPYEILILDQDSDEDTKNYLKKLKDIKIKVFYSDINLGCSGGRKYLVAKAKGDYIVQLDNDLEVKENWLEKMISAIDWKSDIAGACGRVTFPDGKTEYNGCSYTIDGKYITYTLNGNGLNEKELSLLAEGYSDWLPGGATILKASVLKDEVYDENFLNGFEDNDLSFRLEKHGWKFVNCPMNVFIHNHRMFLSKEDLKRDEKYVQQRNDFSRIKASFNIFYKKHKLIIFNPELWRLMGYPTNKPELEASLNDELNKSVK